MRTFVFLALVFLTLASQGQIDFHLKSLIQTGYAVDTVVQLLIALDRTTGGNLQTLIDNWAVTEAACLENIGTLQDLDAAQHQHCADISATINDIENEIRRYKDYVSQAEDKVASNVDTLATRLQARCAANILFVQKLKANQDSTRLLEFLRATIADPGFKAYLDGNNGAFVELKHHMGTNKRNMVSLIAKHHMMSMLQQYTGDDNLNYNLNARSDEEIGSGHVDNDQSALDVDSFTIDARNLDNFIAELLGHIDELIGYLHQENASLQTVEFNAVQSLVEYQDQVEHENIVLATYINIWIGHVADLEVTLAQDQDAWEECQDRAHELDESLASAIADYGARRDNFNERRDSLQHTLDALEEVIRVYVEKVVSASEVYKQRIDDELAKSRPHEPSTVQSISVSVTESAAAAPSWSEPSAAPSWSEETESSYTVGSAEVAWVNSAGTISTATISAGDHYSAVSGWSAGTASTESVAESLVSTLSEELSNIVVGGDSAAWGPETESTEWTMPTVVSNSGIQWVSEESLSAPAPFVVGGDSAAWGPESESTESESSSEEEEEEEVSSSSASEEWTAPSAISASTETESSGASELLNWGPSDSIPAWSTPSEPSVQYGPVYVPPTEESESAESAPVESWPELTGTPEFPSWSAPVVSIHVEEPVSSESESTETEWVAPEESSESSTVSGGIEIPTYHAPTVVESSGSTTLEWNEPSNHWSPPTVSSSEYVVSESSSSSSGEGEEEEEEESAFTIPSLSFKIPDMPEPLWSGASGPVSTSQFVETETSFSVPTVTFSEVESVSVHWVSHSEPVAPAPVTVPVSESTETESESSETVSEEVIEDSWTEVESWSETVTLAWSEAVSAAESSSSAEEEESTDSYVAPSVHIVGGDSAAWGPESSSSEEEESSASWSEGGFEWNDETVEEEEN